MSAWQTAIERGGGIGSAMLYGTPLKALVDELAATQMERDNAIGLAKETEKRVGAEAEELRQARTDLRAERDAYLAVAEREEKLLRRVAAMQALVDAALDEHRQGVPSRNLKAAIEAYKAIR